MRRYGQKDKGPGLSVTGRIPVDETRKDKPGNNRHTFIESSATRSTAEQHENTKQM